jgi:hypothetical protein
MGRALFVLGRAMRERPRMKPTITAFEASPDDNLRIFRAAAILEDE